MVKIFQIFMTLLQSIILGIIEGITEFLPISSTGHLILASKLLGIADTDFLKSFEIAIQLGAILAVVALYWRRFALNHETWRKVLFAFVPTAILGFIFYKLLKTVLLGNAMLVVWSLLLGGIALIVFEIWHKRQLAKGKPDTGITLKKSFALGIVQALAIIPGVSRSGATIVGGLLMGISREKIVEFSFLLAIPTMAAATGYDLLKSGASFSSNDFYVLAIGFIMSFIVAMLAIKWFLNFVKHHTFIWFGVYRIFAAIIFYILFFN